jgi:crotonobetainyl-CoA:carnitine CoA-transferase CaiB-like acyl-CoA transferase
LTEDHFWRSLCRTVGLDSVADLTFADRMRRGDELQERLAQAIRARPRGVLVADLLAVDVPVAPVLDREEMLTQEHFRGRKVVTADPWADPSIGYPILFQEHAARRTSPPPGLDQHRGESFLPRL